MFEALGTTDELSSALGVAREALTKDGLVAEAELVTRLQCCLQDVGAHLATPPDSSDRKKSEWHLTFRTFRAHSL